VLVEFTKHVNDMSVVATVGVDKNDHFVYAGWFFSERDAIARPSVICNVRVPCSGGSNFPQYFYGIRYLGHPLTSTENFTEIVPGEPLCRGS